MSQDESVGPLEESPGYALKQAHAALRTAMESMLRPLGLTVAQYACLELLGQRPGLSSSELARGVFVTRQSMHVVLRGLHDRDMLTRSDPTKPSTAGLCPSSSPPSAKITCALPAPPSAPSSRRCSRHCPRHTSADYERILPPALPQSRHPPRPPKADRRHPAGFNLTGRSPASSREEIVRDEPRGGGYTPAVASKEVLSLPTRRGRTQGWRRGGCRPLVPLPPKGTGWSEAQRATRGRPPAR